MSNFSFKSMSPTSSMFLPQAQVLCNGVIESLGRVEFEGKIDHAFTAHPKLDTDTGNSLSNPSWGLTLQ